MSLPFHPYAELFPLLEGAELEALAEDIRSNGVRDKIELYEGAILDGRNRYRSLEWLVERSAQRGSGWGAYAGQPLTVEDLDPGAGLPWFERFSPMLDGDPLAYVISKNLKRRHLNESQRAMVAAKLANLGHGGDRRPADEQAANLPLAGAPQRPAVTQAAAARMLNVSQRTVRAAVAVQEKAAPELRQAVEQGKLAVSAAVLAAKLEPETQRIIAERAMAGQTRPVATIIKQEGRAAREAELATKQKALPERKYGVILADPEWRFEPYSRDTGMDRAADNHYPTSPLMELMRRPVGDLAADDCVIGLWATVPMLIEAICCLDAWGFLTLVRDPATGFLLPDKSIARYVSQGVWTKYWPGQGIGMGHWFRVDHEILLIATRGSPIAPAQGEQWRSIIDQPASEVHSQKPELVYELFEKFWPNTPKIELNARKARPGWDAWGNEAPESEPAARPQLTFLPIEGACCQRDHEAAQLANDPLDIPPFLRRQTSREAQP